jgi:uncharacterized protein YuzE
MAPHEMKFSYDSEADVLYCWESDPQEAISVETEAGVFLRLDPMTDRPVGITIVDFVERFTSKPGSVVSVPHRQIPEAVQR